jgi:hypothetical protein
MKFGGLGLIALAKFGPSGTKMKHDTQICTVGTETIESYSSIPINPSTKKSFLVIERNVWWLANTLLHPGGRANRIHRGDNEKKRTHMHVNAQRTARLNAKFTEKKGTMYLTATKVIMPGEFIYCSYGGSKFKEPD